MDNNIEQLNKIKTNTLNAAEQLMKIATDVTNNMIEKSIQNTSSNAEESGEVVIQEDDDVSTKYLHLRNQLDSISYIKIKKIIDDLNNTSFSENISNTEDIIKSLQNFNNKIELLITYLLGLIFIYSDSPAGYLKPSMIEAFSLLSASYVKSTELIAKISLEDRKLKIETGKLKLQEQKLEYERQLLESKLTNKEDVDKNMAGSLNDLIEKFMLEKAKKVELEDPYAFSEEEKTKIDTDLKLTDD